MVLCILGGDAEGGHEDPLIKIAKEVGKANKEGAGICSKFCSYLDVPASLIRSHFFSSSFL